MNRAFIVIAVPALITSFCWLLYDWGLRVAIPVTLVELAIAAGVIIHVRRRERSEAGRS